MDLSDKRIVNNIKFLSAATIFAALISYFIYIRIRNKREVSEILEAIKEIEKEGKSIGGNEFFGGFSKDSKEYQLLPNKQPPFKLGDKSKIIYDVQNRMNEKYKTKLRLDGILGENTIKALCEHVWACSNLLPDFVIRKYTLTQSDIDKIFE